MLRAVLWDIDGTLAETECDGHRVAFNRAFERTGVPWRWDERYYGELLRIAGGRERLLHDMESCDRAPHAPEARVALAAAQHALKNDYYVRIVKEGRLSLRAGVLELLNDCTRAGVLLGIATTTSRCNVEALLAQELGQDWSARFATVVCAEDAPRKKPDPQAYEKALEALALPPSEVIAIEDSPAGATAAQRAGLAVVVTSSYYFPACNVDVLARGPSLGTTEGWSPPADRSVDRIDLGQLMRWQAAP
ncbi:MAG: HAD-IA family hydrolase [Proteobacteria bacterium]|nr:HAD-IA family hydrolase [Pseudomonadota bacterium]